MDILLPVPPPPSNQRKFANQIPVNIFTGFLGSGKTTLISSLIDQVKTEEKVVYVKNEIGEIDLDSKILAGQGIVSQQMLNGCVCCTLVGPLMNTLSELIDLHHPDRIILESSGTAEPINLAVTITGNQLVYRDSLVTVIDALHYTQEPRYNDHYQLQAKLTDLLVLNKIEQINPDQKEKVIEALRSVNPISPLVEAANGVISKDLVFGLVSTIATNQQEVLHHHEHDLESFTLNLPSTIDLPKIELVLDSLPEEIIRVKGIMFTPEPVLCNQAYKRRNFSKPSSFHSDDKPFLYFIGPNISQYKNTLQQKIDTCTSDRILGEQSV